MIRRVRIRSCCIVVFWGVILLTCFSSSVSVGAVTISDSKFVYDEAGFLEPEEEQLLEDQLATLRETTSAEIAIVIMETLGGREPFDVAMNLARNLDSEESYVTSGPTGGVGSEKFNNGVVILIAAQERKRQILVGSGLEGALPDALIKRYGESILVPAFRNDQYGAGLFELVTTLGRVIRGESELREEVEAAIQSDSPGLLDIFLVYFFIVFFFGAFIKERLPTKKSKQKGALVGSGLMGGLGVMLAGRTAILLIVPLYLLWSVVLSGKVGTVAPGSSRRSGFSGFGGGSSSFGGGFSGFGGGSFSGGGAGGSR